MLKFPDSLNLSFHNLSIHQFSRKDLSLAQFIPRIYNKIIIKILGYFWGVTHSVIMNKVYKDCPIKIREYKFLGDLIELSFWEFDVILGMDWLS